MGIYNFFTESFIMVEQGNRRSSQTNRRGSTVNRRASQTGRRSSERRSSGSYDNNEIEYPKSPYFRVDRNIPYATGEQDINMYLDLFYVKERNNLSCPFTRKKECRPSSKFTDNILMGNHVELPVNMYTNVNFWSGANSHYGSCKFHIHDLPQDHNAVDTNEFQSYKRDITYKTYKLSQGKLIQDANPTYHI